MPLLHANPIVSQFAAAGRVLQNRDAVPNGTGQKEITSMPTVHTNTHASMHRYCNCLGILVNMLCDQFRAHKLLE